MNLKKLFIILLILLSSSGFAAEVENYIKCHSEKKLLEDPSLELSEREIVKDQDGISYKMLETTIKWHNKTIVQFQSIPGMCASEYFSDLNLFLFYMAPSSDGILYWLVNRKNGHATQIVGTPIFSPTKNYIFAWNLMYEIDGEPPYFKIYKIASDSIIEEYALGKGPYPFEAKWLKDDVLSFEIRDTFDLSVSYCMQKINNNWKFSICPRN